MSHNTYQICGMIRSRAEEIAKGVGLLRFRDAFQIWMRDNGIVGQYEDEHDEIVGERVSVDFGNLLCDEWEDDERHADDWWNFVVPKELALKALVLGEMPPADTKSLMREAELENQRYWESQLRVP